jgi:hypothetical protein
MTTYFIYFAEDDSFIGAGECNLETIGEIHFEINKAITKDTNGANAYLRFGIITSEKTNFLKEAQQTDDVVEYLRGIINQIHNLEDEEE